ncbi:MAG: MBL fold metallo-hydrolase [Mangrovibacterium sp.]
MDISILTDNNPGRYTGAEHGLSYFVEHGGTRLLFDTGQSNLFLLNAEIMGLEVTGIDFTVLSHGHFDHGNGLDHLTGGRLVCHPGVFVRRYRSADRSYIGLNHSREELEQKFELITSVTPYLLSENIVFLGEIPRITDFESQKTSFVLDDGTPDFVADDSAIALKTEEGLFVITGCGHAGVVNTLEHARNVTCEDRLFGVMGGFHLKKDDRQTRETIRYLKKNKIKKVYPSHCTAPPAITAFSGHFSISRLKTGDRLHF